MEDHLGQSTENYELLVIQSGYIISELISNREKQVVNLNFQCKNNQNYLKVSPSSQTSHSIVNFLLLI